MENQKNFNILRDYSQKVVEEDRLFELTYDNIGGRYLIAARDIKEGEVLFSEKPLICAPQAGSGPTCLKCLKMLEQINHGNCSKCGGPICANDCKDINSSIITSYHSNKECDILTQLNENPWSSKLIPVMNTALTTVRSWLRIKENRTTLQLILAMQSNCKIREKLPIGKYIDTVLLPIIKDRLKSNIPHEFIHISSGIFDTNAFKISTTDGKLGRVLLPLTALMNHDCCPNTDYWFAENNQCTVRATRDIKRGDKFTNCYTNTFLPTNVRSLNLKCTKLFTCHCDRCEDLTEFGTNIGSFLCRACNSGLLQAPHKGVTTSSWQCQSCGAKITQEMAATLTKFAARLSSDDERSMKHLPTIVRLVGKQHYSILNVLRISIRDLNNKNINEITDETLLDTVYSGYFVFNVVQFLSPGLSLLQGEIALSIIKMRLEMHKRSLNLSTSAAILNLLSYEIPKNLTLNDLFILCSKIYRTHPVEATLSDIKAQLKMADLI